MADSVNECSICLDKEKTKSFIKTCGHEFCLTCIQEWSKTKFTCPLCRKVFYEFVCGDETYLNESISKTKEKLFNGVDWIIARTLILFKMLKRRNAIVDKSKLIKNLIRNAGRQGKLENVSDLEKKESDLICKFYELENTIMWFKTLPNDYLENDYVEDKEKWSEELNNEYCDETNF